jgi:thioredoxin 1
MAFQFTDANFGEKVSSFNGVTVVDFWAEWCGPCKMIGPYVEQLAVEYEGKALIGKLDVDNNPEVSTAFGVRSIPTILFIKEGKIVGKHVGATSKDALRQKLEEAIAYQIPATV